MSKKSDYSCQSHSDSGYCYDFNSSSSTVSSNSSSSLLHPYLDDRSNLKSSRRNGRTTTRASELISKPDFNDSHFVTVLSINKKECKNVEESGGMTEMRKQMHLNNISRSNHHSSNLQGVRTSCSKKYYEKSHLDKKLIISSEMDFEPGQSKTLPSRSKSLNTLGYVTVLEIGSETKPKNKLAKSSHNLSRNESRDAKFSNKILAAEEIWQERSTSLPPSTGTVLVRIQSASGSKPVVTKPQRKQSINIGPRTEPFKEVGLRRSNSSNSNTFPHYSSLQAKQSLSRITKSSSDNKVNPPDQKSHNNGSFPENSQGITRFVEEDIVIYRLPGEKLGLGLRFEGGSKSNEYVKKLFVQSCSLDSPAAKTKCIWGFLEEGDEVISISGKIVSKMTRVDCVKALKDSPVCVKLSIRHCLDLATFNSNYKSFFKMEGANYKHSEHQSVKQASLISEKSIVSKPQFNHLERSCSIPALKSGRVNFESSAPSNVVQRTGGSLTPSCRATSTTKALIERSRSRAAQMDKLRPTTLPRRRSTAGVVTQSPSGLFIKAHEQKKSVLQSYSMGQGTGKVVSDDYLHEEFVDDEEDNVIFHDDHIKTLPRDYKVNNGRSCNHLVKSDLSNISRSKSVGELSHTTRVKGRVQLVVSSNSFVSCTLPRPPKPARSGLNGHDKGSKETKGLPPEAEVYVNLLDDNIQLPTEKNNLLEVEMSSKADISDVETSSTLSTIHSRHVTPSHSKISTPKSSFAKADKGQFDLAKLLDPFEKLEREFKWDDVTPLRPPSAFGSQHMDNSDLKHFVDDQRRISFPNLSNLGGTNYSEFSKSLIKVDQNEKHGLESSNAGSFAPPPTFSRLPPDGHEFPPEYKDPTISKLGEHRKISIEREEKETDEILNLKGESNLRPDELPDETPEFFKSITNNVKAKIALYSNPTSLGVVKSPKSKEREIRTLEDDPLKLLKKTNNCKSLLDVSSYDKETKLKCYHDTTSTQVVSKCPLQLQSRSQSLMEVGPVANKPVTKLLNSNLNCTANSKSAWNKSQSEQTQNPVGVHPKNMKQSESTNVKTSKEVTRNPNQKIDFSSCNTKSYSNDSDNDSAVSSARSSMSRGSESPPTDSKSSIEINVTNNPRVLKKDSDEAINRRNIIESCRSRNGLFMGKRLVEITESISNTSPVVKSSPKHQQIKVIKTELNDSSTALSKKPVSRASSFTIAERKKSFEVSNQVNQTIRHLTTSNGISRRNSFQNSNITDIQPARKNIRLVKAESLGCISPIITNQIKSSSEIVKAQDKLSLSYSTYSLDPDNEKLIGHETLGKSLFKSEKDLKEEKKLSGSLKTLPCASKDPIHQQKLDSDKFSLSKKVELLKTSPSFDNQISTTPKNISKYQPSQESGRRRCVSVNDIRKAFEKAEQSLNQNLNGFQGAQTRRPNIHQRMSSLDSTTSEDSSILTPTNTFGSVSSLVTGQSNLKDHYGSISSLASSTSMISQQELQGLIDEANQSLEESGTPAQEIMVIVLHREFQTGSVGITLAGGADYESKEITVHKVIPGTLADRDGRIQKGDRVLSINGKSTKGVTHRDALTILKTPRAEVVLVLSRGRSVTPSAEISFENTDYYFVNSGRPPKILEYPFDIKSYISDLKFVDVPRGPPLTITLKKEGTGLGFSLEGGKDSPQGDRPLIVKKLFLGGVAEKTTQLKIGDEIVSVNGTDVTRMTRLEAWNFMKKLSDGNVTIVVRQPLRNEYKQA